MFQWFSDVRELLKRGVEALEGLYGILEELPTRSNTPSELEGRVKALEVELDKKLAQAEGLELRAEGQMKAARAAEERARRLQESASRATESDEDELTLEEAEQLLEAAGLHVRNGELSPSEGVSPVSSGVVPGQEDPYAAHRLKWSRRRE